MAIKSLFPQEMLNSSSGEMTLEGVVSKLDYYVAQVQLIHWQTSSHAEHSALNFYDEIHDFKDEITEKLMGYMGRKVKAFKRLPITDNADSTALMTEIISFAHDLMEWAGQNKYCDIENISQSFSGSAAKTKYLLTQS